MKLSKDRLRAQCLPKDASSSYVRVTVDGHLAGNAFACRWKYNDKSVCWVTQLVVDRDYRQRGLATGLLNELRRDDDDIYGLVSSHAAACMAAAKAFGGKRTLRIHIENSILKMIDTMKPVKLDFIRDHAEGIMTASPISYVKNAKLQGRLFKPNDASGIISCVDTRFFVDHTEPLEALAWARENRDWPLGELADGHEFLLILEARRRARFRSQPKSAS